MINRCARKSIGNRPHKHLRPRASCNKALRPKEEHPKPPNVKVLNNRVNKIVKNIMKEDKVLLEKLSKR